MKRVHLQRLFYILISFFPYTFVFLGSLWQPIDADLGWHLKYGEYFYNHLAPLRNNPYSASMQNYYWPNSSWITDVISYTTFKTGNFLGLSILSAVIVTATFFFIAKAFKLTFLKQSIFFPLILYLEIPINSVSLRGQQISLLFLAILLYLLNTSDRALFNKKIKKAYLIPPLFLVWINTHGEFLLGFGVMGIWVLGKLIYEFFTTEKIQSPQFLKKKEKPIYESPYTRNNFLKACNHLMFWVKIFILSLCATFINPFGIGLYKEAITHVGNADLKYISEYLPFGQFTEDWRNIILTGSLLLFGIIILFFNNTLFKKLPNVLIVVVLFFLSLWIKRFAWAFYYTTPAVLGAYLGFDKENTKWGYVIGSSILLLCTIVIFTYKNPLQEVTRSNWNTYCNSFINCSPKSARKLQTIKIEEPLWSNYNWGGWLIWNYPTVKPFIDGRMHLWKENGYSAFDEYYPLEQNVADIQTSRFNTAYVWRDKPIAKRIDELIKEGKWKLVYEDNKAIIAERILTTK